MYEAIKKSFVLKYDQDIDRISILFIFFYQNGYQIIITAHLERITDFLFLAFFLLILEKKKNTTIKAD